MNIKFLKSTLFRGKITTKGKEGFKENIEIWEKMVREMGYLVKKQSTLITPKITVSKRKIKVKKGEKVLRRVTETKVNTV